MSYHKHNKHLTRKQLEQILRNIELFKKWREMEKKAGKK